jgi:hypothetical protein
MNRLTLLGTTLVAITLASAAKGEAVSPASQDSRSPSPQAVVILADLTSVAGSPRNVGEVRAAIAGAIRRVLGSSDLVAIGSFTGQTRIPVSLTPARPNLNSALDEAFDVRWNERFGNCLIWDALIQAVDLLNGLPVGTRRRVVLFTAGRGSGNLATPARHSHGRWRRRTLVKRL